MTKFKDLLEWAFEPPKRSNELGFQFVMAELETGLMFYRQAVGTEGEQGAQYRVNARSSYESAMWHVKALTLTTDERQAFENKERQLRTAIETL
jgi:hypothetical protein